MRRRRRRFVLASILFYIYYALEWRVYISFKFVRCFELYTDLSYTF